jgi:hypothetical protein
MLESVIEAYFVAQVKKHGGLQRKIAYVNRRDATDRFVVFPPGRVSFVELKRPGEVPRINQLREHARLRAVGCDVWTISTLQGVDAFIKEKTKCG